MFDLNSFINDLNTVVSIDSNSYDVKGLNRCVDAYEKIAREQAGI